MCYIKRSNINFVYYLSYAHVSFIIKYMILFLVKLVLLININVVEGENKRKENIEN